MEGLSSTNSTRFRTTFCIISIIRVLVGLGQLPRVQAYGVYLGGFVYRTGFTRGITLAKKGHSAAWGSIQCSCESGLHWGNRSPSEVSERGDRQRVEESFYALIQKKGRLSDEALIVLMCFDIMGESQEETEKFLGQGGEGNCLIYDIGIASMEAHSIHFS